MLGKKALFTAAVGTGTALLTGTALYAFELNHLTSDAKHQIENLSRQITAQEVRAFVWKMLAVNRLVYHSNALSDRGTSLREPPHER